MAKLNWSKPTIQYNFNNDLEEYGCRSHTSTLYKSKIYVFGGGDLTRESNQLMIFDTEAMFWIRPETTGAVPSPRRAHSSALVEMNGRHRMLIYGGGCGTDHYDQLYSLDLLTLKWSRIENKGKSPGTRKAHTFLPILNGKKILLFGGADGNQALNETYILDTEKMEWDMLKTTGEKPKPRGYHSANLVGDQMYIYGGSDGQSCLSDLFSLDIEKGVWTERKTSKGGPICAHTTNTVGNSLYVFGGMEGPSNTLTNEWRVLNLDPRLDRLEWNKKLCTGTPPSPRGYHTSVLHDARFFIFGGFDGKKCQGDTFIVDLGIDSCNLQRNK